MTLIKHHARYWSERWEVSENTFILKEDRDVYIGGPGTRGRKIGKKLPKGTLIRIDQCETDEKQGYYRAYYISDASGNTPIPGFFNDWIVEALQTYWPNAPELWQVYFDWSGCGTWPVPIPVPVDPPEPIDPEPDPIIPEIVVQFEVDGSDGGRYLVTVEKIS